MKEIKLTIETLAPIVIARNFGDRNLIETLGYIPASSILGIFASEYIKQKPIEHIERDEAFYNWFLNGKIIFTNAYLFYEGKEFLPCPFTLQKEKTDNNTIYNLLEPSDSKDTTAVNEFVNIYNGKEVKTKIPETIINFHHARDSRIGGKSTEGKIFYYEAIKEGQLFCSYIIGEEEQIDKFKKTFLSPLKANIGRSRNIQYGYIRIEIDDKVSNYDDLEIENEFTITFTSPALFYNKYGYPEPSIETLTMYLENILNISKGEISIKKTFSKIDRFENFISVWKLKTPLEIAFAEGSTFRIEIKSNSFNDNVQQNIKSALMTGIGERTYQGFGRFTLNMLTENEYTLSVYEEKTVDKPTECPAVITKILTEILKKNLLESAQKLAQEFKLENKPSNSLLGRLELMLRQSENIKDFKNKINPLKAKEDLENCTFNNKPLNVMLEDDNYPNSFKQIKDTPYFNELSTLAKECSLEIKDAFKEEVYKTYWLNALRAMRKEGD